MAPNLSCSLSDHEWMTVARKSHPECSQTEPECCKVELLSDPVPLGEPAIGYRSRGRVWRINYSLDAGDGKKEPHTKEFFVKEYGRESIRSSSGTRMDIRCQREWRAANFFASQSLEGIASRGPLVPRMYLFLPDRKLLAMEFLGEATNGGVYSTVLGRDLKLLDDDEVQLLTRIFEFVENQIKIRVGDLTSDPSLPNAAYILENFRRRGFVTLAEDSKEINLTQRALARFECKVYIGNEPSVLSETESFKRERVSLIGKGLEAILAFHHLGRVHGKISEDGNGVVLQEIPDIPQPNFAVRSQQIGSKLGLLIGYEDKICPVHSSTYRAQVVESVKTAVMRTLLQRMIAPVPAKGRLGLADLTLRYGDWIIEDCHPLNMMLRTTTTNDKEVVLIDLSHLTRGYWASDVVGHLMFARLFCGFEKERTRELLEESYQRTKEARSSIRLESESKEAFDFGVQLLEIERSIRAAGAISGIVINHEEYGLDEHERISSQKRRSRYVKALQQALQDVDEEALRADMLKNLRKVIPEIE